MGNVMYENQCNGNGGGICCSDFSYPVLGNNTICDNRANNGGGLSFHGLSADEPSNCRVLNNIVRGNAADAEGQQVFLFDFADPVFSNCNIEGGVEEFGLAQGVEYDSVYGTTNIDVDPLFAEAPEWPYEISENSPCIDMGETDTSLLIGGTINLTERIWDGDGDEIAVVDIGAYEFGAPPSREDAVRPSLFRAGDRAQFTMRGNRLWVTGAAGGRVALFDLRGRRVFEKEMVRQHETFSLENLGGGMYIFKYSIPDKRIMSSTIVLMK